MIGVAHPVAAIEEVALKGELPARPIIRIAISQGLALGECALPAQELLKLLGVG
jgi:hypothetical protein